MLVEFIEVLFGASANSASAVVRPGHEIAPSESQSSEASDSDESDGSELVQEEDVMNKEIKPVHDEVSELTMITTEQSVETSISRIDELKVNASDVTEVVSVSVSGGRVFHRMAQQENSSATGRSSLPETHKVPTEDGAAAFSEEQVWQASHPALLPLSETNADLALYAKMAPRSEEEEREKSSPTLLLSLTEAAVTNAAPLVEIHSLGEAHSKASHNSAEDCMRELHLRDMYMKEKMEMKLRAQQEKEKKRSKQLMQTFFKKYIRQDDKSVSNSSCPSSKASTCFSDLTQESGKHGDHKTSSDRQCEEQDLLSSPRQRGSSSPTTFTKKIHKILETSSKKKQTTTTKNTRRESLRMKIGASLSKKLVVGQ